MVFYGLKTCDTCRKAEKAIVDSGLQLTKVDVREDGIPEDALQRFLSEFGEELLNRRSTTWRNLSDTDRNSDPVTLISVHPTVMKRPVIDADGRLFLGWGKDVQASLLGS